jgi:MFS-type transporter involved in bile tolerance (Atg22 family)
MQLLPGLLILLGLVIFMIGYYYFAKSTGQNECSTVDKKEIEQSQSANYIGGIIGLVIAIILVIVGFILNSQTAKAALIKSLS